MSERPKSTIFSGSLTGSAGHSIDFDLHLPAGPGSHAVVVICHGFKGFRNWGFFPELAESLARAGYAALRLDLSHNGIDRETGLEFTRLDLFEANRPSYEIADLGAVLSALRDGRLYPELDLRRSGFGMLGHSRGGAASILAASGRDDVSAVVTWASVSSLTWSAEVRASAANFGYWEALNSRTGQLMRVGRAAIEEATLRPEEFDIAGSAARLGDRLLLVHGVDDPAVPFSAAVDLEAWSGHRAGLIAITDADHVMNCRHPFAGRTEAFERALRASLNHLSARL